MADPQKAKSTPPPAILSLRLPSRGQAGQLLGPPDTTNLPTMEEAQRLMEQQAEYEGAAQGFPPWHRPYGVNVGKDLQDLGLGLGGIRDPFWEGASRATQTGAALGAIPMVGAAIRTGPMLIKGLTSRAALVDDYLANLFQRFGTKGQSYEEVLSQATLAPQVTERIAAGRELGQARGANWHQPEAVNSRLVDPRVVRQFWRGQGATTPNTDIKTSTLEGLMLRIMDLENVPMDYASLREAGVTNVVGKVENANRAYYTGQPLRSYQPGLQYPEGLPGKAEAMARYYLGERRLPADVHVLRLMGARERAFDDAIPLIKARVLRETGQEINEAQAYDLLDAAYWKSMEEIDPVAARLEFTKMHGDAWEGARIIKGGLPNEGGAVDILQRIGATEPGVLESPTAMRIVLANQGKIVPPGEELTGASVRRATDWASRVRGKAEAHTGPKPPKAEDIYKSIRMEDAATEKARKAALAAAADKAKKVGSGRSAAAKATGRRSLVGTPPETAIAEDRPVPPRTVAESFLSDKLPSEESLLREIELQTTRLAKAEAEGKTYLAQRIRDGLKGDRDDLAKLRARKPK